MEQDQDQVEFFLDNGWSVIGRLHRWLSTSQSGTWEQSELVELIRCLQLLWTASEDLNLTRIAYSSLMLEQLLERFCAGTLEFKTERLNDITAGVEVLQDLLLGLEATRKEPENFKLEVLLRLYRHSTEPLWHNTEQKVLVATAVENNVLRQLDEPESQGEILQPETLFVEEAAPKAELVKQARNPESVAAVNRISVESTLLAMLEQFVNKLDDTCHRLHARMVADEAPYVTTTTRLEHLVQVTRELVSQLAGNNEYILPDCLDKSLSDSEKITQSPVIEAVGEPTSLKETLELDSSPPGVEPEIAKPMPEAHIEETRPSIHLPGDTEVPAGPQRILIVEESLFYRQMISVAVRSMGYEPQAVISVDAGIEKLKQPEDYCAILVDAVMSPVMSEVIEVCRREHGIKVVGMTSTISEGCFVSDLDDQVARSNPRQLREILSRLLADSTVASRRNECSMLTTSFS